MWFYDLGKTNPIIITPYTESDMLDYSTAVVSAMVAVLALIYSVVTNTMRFSISHAFTIDDNNKECILIRICNDSQFECKLQSVSITNKQNNRSAHIIRRKPFVVKGKSAKEFPVPITDIKKVLKHFTTEKSKNRLFYELRMETGSHQGSRQAS